MSRTQTRRARQIREQIDFSQAAAEQFRQAAGEILSLRRRARWGSVAWAIVAVQAVLLAPAAVMFLEVCRACGGPIIGTQITALFVYHALRDLMP